MWKREENLWYTISYANKKLRNEVKGKEEEVYTKLWKTKTMPIAQFFAWIVLKIRIAMYDKLHNRGIQINNKISVTYNTNDKTISHLFFTCGVTCKIWKKKKSSDFTS